MSTPVRRLVTEGLLVILEANPGREQEAAVFLESALRLVEEEPGWTCWLRSYPSPRWTEVRR